MSEPALAGPPDAIDFTSLSRVLVVMLRHHGDVLLTTPVYRALKRAHPTLQIDVVIYQASQPLVQFNPDLTRVFAIDKEAAVSALARVAAELRLMRGLRARRYDLLIHLTENRRGAWLSRWLQPRISIAPRLRHMDAFWRGSFTHFWSNAVSVSGGNPLLRRHTVDQHLDALRRLGMTIAAAPALCLIPGAQGDALAEQFLHQHGVDRPFVLIQPTSRWAFKCWPVAHNAALIQTLLRRGLMVVLSCGPSASERSMLKAIVSHLGGPQAGLVLADEPSTLNRLAALIGRARAFVGIDSAPMHIAAAMGTPTVALFGPSGDDNWAPWSGDSNLVAQVVSAEQFKCRPCGQDGCGGSKVSQCLVQLPMSQVLRALDEVIERSDPSMLA